MATSTVHEIKSAAVPDLDLVNLELFAESLGETPLATFLTEMVEMLRNGHDFVLLSS